MASFLNCVRCNKRHDQSKMKEFFLSWEPETIGVFLQSEPTSGRFESGWMFGSDCAKRLIKNNGKRDW